MRENRRLNESHFAAVVDRPGFLPCFSEIAGRFEMHAPAVVLGARPAQENVPRQKHRLILYRAESSVRQAFGSRPGSSVVGRAFEHSPPSDGTGADLIKQQQLAGRTAE